MSQEFNMKFRLWLLDTITPLTITIGKIHMPYSQKKIKGEDYIEMDKVIKDGMVILTKTYGQLTNLLIPGNWTHAMIYVGGGYVVEAVGRGVIIKDFPSAVLTKDEICILTPTFATDKQMISAAQFALSKVGSPYDYYFMGNNLAFYCSELIYAAYNEATGGKTPFKLRDSLGVPTAIPDDIFLAKDKWKEICLKRGDSPIVIKKKKPLLLNRGDT